MSYLVMHYIKGELIPSARKQALYDPSLGKTTGQVCMADRSIIDQSVSAAKTAFSAWSALTALKRARYLFKFKMLLEKNIDELAQLITREHGKTLNDARGSVQRGIDVVEYVCGITSHLKGSFSENIATDIDSYSLRQPLGVCVGITPFNFPGMIPLWMFPMAIACGNTFILKPSEKDPSCSIRLAQLAKEAGIPEGVINVVQGDQEAVDALITHPDVKAVSFVGSTKVAEHVYQTATSHGKRVQAFGGAKNHCVVMPDADINYVVDSIVGAAYGSAGERCMAISVVITIGDALADELVKRIKPRVQNLKIGPGTSPEVEMGPLVTQAHWERVKSYVDLGLKEGANLVVDGRGYESNEGFYLGGSLFDKVTREMRIYKEEIFGPVLCVMRAPDLTTAIQWISENEYGNGTAIFTRDGNAARTFAQQVQVGMVGINVPIPVPAAQFSFGGWKRSMFGDIAMHGQEGVHFFTKLKTIIQRWPESEEGASFIIPTH